MRRTCRPRPSTSRAPAWHRRRGSWRARPPHGCHRPAPTDGMRLSRAALAAGSVLLFATCDMVTAPVSKHVVVAYRGDSTLVVGQTAAPGVAVTVDGERVADARVRYTSLDTTRLRVSADGQTVTALRRRPPPPRIAPLWPYTPPDRPREAQLDTDNLATVRMRHLA